MRLCRFALALALGALLAIAQPARAATITFDELPFQPVNGLSFMGVTFGFTVLGAPSSDANYNSVGPGVVTFVQDPSLEGNASGILTLDFSVPVSSLQFGVALSSVAPLTPGFGVALYDSSLTLLGVSVVNTNPLISFSEGQFSYSGTSVARAVVNFNNSGARFAFDNLEFEAVPEPATLLLLGSGLVGLAARRRRAS